MEQRNPLRGFLAVVGVVAMIGVVAHLFGASAQKAMFLAAVLTPAAVAVGAAVWFVVAVAVVGVRWLIGRPSPGSPPRFY
jgi:hypothetical protein